MTDMKRMNKREAKQLPAEIRRGIADLKTLVLRAWTGGAWSALGYESWNDYSACEFEPGYIKLPRGERMKTVGALTHAGMSTRDIASSLGVSHMTVRRDRIGTNVPMPERITCTDGRRSYPATRPADKVAEAEEHATRPADKVIEAEEQCEEQGGTWADVISEETERREFIEELEVMCVEIDSRAEVLRGYGGVGIEE
jgi:hypothetical protein